MTADTLIIKTQDMNLTPDRQGYLGDLRNKTIQELKELLERQENILLKRKFLESLPDKGEKTRTFAAHLKQLIEQKSHQSSAAQAFIDNLPVISHDTLSAEKSNTVVRNIVSDKASLDIDAARNELNVKVQLDNNKADSDINEETSMDSSTSIVSSLEKMSIGSQKSQEEIKDYINSYERVIKKAEVKSVNQKPKFLPNRTLHDDHIPKSPYPHDTRPPKTEMIEESAVKPPNYKFQTSKLISIEESVKLIEQQRMLNEELIAQRAANKLASQLVPKMNLYSPSITDMQYRKTAEDYQDSDDDNDDDGSHDEEY